jgi:DUF4097 and DUF4098 domain-containing protein YvlB
MANWEFDAAGPVRADIEIPSGSVEVTAARTGTVRVLLTASNNAGEKLLADTEVSFEGDTLRVHAPTRSARHNASLDLTIELPEGSTVNTKTASADQQFDGELGPLHATTASGDLQAKRVNGDADLTTASGDIRLGETSEDVRATTASGDVHITQAGGDIIVKTASGDLWVGQAGRSVSAKTASGDVHIDSIASGLVDTTTVSGDVTVAVVPGVSLYMDISTLTGDVRSDLDAGPGDAGSGDAEDEVTLTLSCRSVSGDVRILRARNPR